MNEFKQIRIDGVVVNSFCKDYRVKNALEYVEPCEKLSDGTIDVEFRDYYYRPSIDFEFGKMSITEYRNVIAKINRPSFLVEYFDYTLGKVVLRTMTCNQNDIERLCVAGGEIERISGLTVAFESIYTFIKWSDL